jgi:hypothetical protein
VAKLSARTEIIDGETTYLLSGDEYERLTQTRRQVGSYTTRLNVLRQQTRIDADILEEIHTLLADHQPCAPAAADQPSPCALCRIRTAIARHHPAALPPSTTSR